MDQKEFELFSKAYTILVKTWYREKYGVEVTDIRVGLKEPAQETPKPAEEAVS